MLGTCEIINGRVSCLNPKRANAWKGELLHHHSLTIAIVSLFCSSYYLQYFFIIKLDKMKSKSKVTRKTTLPNILLHNKREIFHIHSSIILHFFLIKIYAFNLFILFHKLKRNENNLLF